ncbi:MAG: coenzyme F390 synthetase, partial [Methanoregulaceae archaeon]|nr:coenzyme F390 synthetase [Methanoregulaceae archaeon]
LTREPCPCGRTHMRIMNPQREAETVWILGTPVNRVDIERGVFQQPNMEYLTGEYEAFVYGGDEDEETILRVSMECTDPDSTPGDEIAETFRKSFFRYKPALARSIGDTFSLIFSFTEPGGLELYRLKGRPKRVVDRRA